MRFPRGEYLSILVFAWDRTGIVADILKTAEGYCNFEVETSRPSLSTAGFSLFNPESAIFVYILLPSSTKPHAAALKKALFERVQGVVDVICY